MASSSVVGTAVSEDSLFIPLIDFSRYLSDDPAGKAAVGKGMTDGFKNAGFVYIKNHGIPDKLVKEVFSLSARFFDRTKEDKLNLAWTTPESNRGYSAQGREKTTQLADKDAVDALRSSQPDLKESFEIGREGVPGLPNNWPSDNDGEEFRSKMLKFHDICKNMHVLVMRTIALGLDLEETYFDRFCDGGDNTLRLLHYPPAPRKAFLAPSNQVRAGKHSDYGSITLLFQDQRGGLQVRSPNGNFINATPIPGTIVINAGDLLARWSNNIIASTEHQVVNPPETEAEKNMGEEELYPARYSCAYFCNPNYEAIIDAIPGTYKEGKAKEEGGKKYEPISSGDYLVQRLSATYVTSY